MTAINLLWGPATAGDMYVGTSALSSTSLNDSNNAVGLVMQLPKSGTIDRVGFYMPSKTGSPPTYKVGLVTVDSSGRPTQTAYGGSAIEDYTPGTTGWVWVTLATPATGVLGEFCAVHIYPGGTTPDGSNYINVTIGKPVAYMYGNGVYYTTVWVENGGLIPMALSYDDGSVYGMAISSNVMNAGVVRSNTTPDEVGAKFTLPFAAKVKGARFFSPYINYGSACAFDVVLYDNSNNVLASATISDKDYVDIGSDVVNVFFAETTLSADTPYRIVVKPTVSTNGDIYVGRIAFESAAAKAALPVGAAFDYTYRTDAGAWTDSTTDLPYMGLWISDLTLTSGGSGGEFAYIG